MAAGYTDNSSGPGEFSKRLMSTLEDLANPGELVKFASVVRKLQERIEDDVEPVVKGNHGALSIILTPIMG